VDISVFFKDDRFSQEIKTHLSIVTNYSRRQSAEDSCTIKESKNPRAVTEELEA